MEEEQVGRVTNFYVKISVAAIKVTSGVIRIGDTVHFKGHTTDFEERVASIEIQNQPVDKAGLGKQWGRP